MKNKKLLYILIPLVLLLWGAIIYRIFNVVSVNDSNEVYKSEVYGNTDNANLIDTFSINPNYRDPFLGKSAKKTILSENKVSNIVVNPNVIKKIIPSSRAWPNLVYGGLIKNQKSNKALALVQINGQSNIMKIGEIVGEIELTKIFRDSIEVKFQKEKRFVKK